MADRTCTLCGKEFPKPCWLRKHKARKTPCAPILVHTDLALDVQADPHIDAKKCRFCGRVLSCYTSMRRHVRVSCKIAPNAKNGDAGMEALYEHTVRQQQMIDTQQEILARQSKLIDRLVSRDAAEVSIQIPGNSNQVSIDNRKFINIFGQEVLDHATVENIKQILDESMRGAVLPMAASAAVVKTAMLVYSDPKHPENLTCYLPNKKTDDVLVHANGGWEVQPASLVLQPMAQKSVDTLFSKQPYEDAAEYGPLMKELAENEKRYVTGVELRPILVRNKDLLMRALKTLPVVTE